MFPCKMTSKFKDDYFLYESTMITDMPARSLSINNNEMYHFNFRSEGQRSLKKILILSHLDLFLTPPLLVRMRESELETRFSSCLFLIKTLKQAQS